MNGRVLGRWQAFADEQIGKDQQDSAKEAQDADCPGPTDTLKQAC